MLFSRLGVGMAKLRCLRFFLIPFGLGGLTACASQTVIYTPDLASTPLKGATAQVLMADFGPPLLQRTDGPAQVWLYQTATCDLDVFLYRDASGTPRVTTILPDNGADLHNCLLGLTQPTTAAALERNPAS